jgi:hypothetical protein
MSAFFVGVAHLFAVVPGVAILQSGLGAPPQYGTLFGGTIEALGALTLVLLWTNRGRLKQWSARRATRWAIGLAVAWLVFLVAYLVLFQYSVVTERYSGQTVYYPLWLAGRAAQMVAAAGSRSAAIARYGPDGVRDALEALTLARMTTTVLLLLLYQANFTALTAAFGIIGFHGGKDLPNPASTDPGSSSAP